MSRYIPQMQTEGTKAAPVPAGQSLRRHQTTEEGGLRVDAYWTYVCPHCPLEEQPD